MGVFHSSFLCENFVVYTQRTDNFLLVWRHTVTIAISPLPVENPSVAPFCSDDMGGWVSNSVLLSGWIFGGSVALKSPVLAFPLSMTDVWVFISVASDSV